MLENVDDIITNVLSKDRLKQTFEERLNLGNNFSLSVANTIKVTDKMRKDVLELLSATPVAFEVIAKELELELPVLYTICLELELAGRISRSAGNKIALVY